MEINNIMQNDITSVRQSIGISLIKKSVNQDAQSISALLEGMQAANAKTLEHSVTPHKGGGIDIRL
jgi:hypothetical protein